MISWRSSSNVARGIIPVFIATKRKLATAHAFGVAADSTRRRFCAAPVVLKCPSANIWNAGPFARSADQRSTRAVNRIIPCTSRDEEDVGLWRRCARTASFPRRGHERFLHRVGPACRCRGFPDRKGGSVYGLPDCANPTSSTSCLAYFDAVEMPNQSKGASNEHF